MSQILIVEDEVVIRSALRRLLERNGYEVLEAGSVEEARQIELDQCDLIISDLRLPGEEGTHMIAYGHQLERPIPVLIMTSYASMKSAVDAMKLGAADYIAKPFDHEEMINTVARTLEKGFPTQQVQESPSTAHTPELNPQVQTTAPKVANAGFGQFVGECEAMKKVYSQILRIAPAPVTVLVHGESGTGKELAAKAIHDHSSRAHGPLVSVNCAAIPESLIESELFGHEKGAFTGAVGARQGLVEAAENGTLFLDEIGELPMEAQARLLRVLQEHEIRRLGSVHAKKIDVRLIAATHRNLRELVQAGRFREDLYYRLQVVEINLPALRERDRDVLLIAKHLLQVQAQRLNTQAKPLSKAASQLMLSYQWPGNVRELENTIQRALLLEDGPEITPEALGIASGPALSQSDNFGYHSAPMMSDPIDDNNNEELSLEEYFQQFVLEHQDEMSETELAQKLGISRKTLWEKRQKLGIPRKKK